MRSLVGLTAAAEHACSAVVAIPANNEADRIESCLAALAMQRNACGSPLPAGRFAILVFANGCTDGTVQVIERFAGVCPHPIVVVSEQLPPERANAGWARKRAMDLAAEYLAGRSRAGGVILTTDADSCVAPTWVSASLAALDEGADCVAGYIDAFPAEIMRLGPAFVKRGRLEDRYLRLAAEIYARCDPRPHDPWPNHRVSSGASLAVTLTAYRAVGGLPPMALGEDAAFTYALDCAGFRVRHSMAVTVATSCRFDGRATGGAADTMRLRHAVEDAPCDDDMEPALPLVRRALLKGRLRRDHAAGTLTARTWAARLGLSVTRCERELAGEHRGFAGLWTRLEALSPGLARRTPLRPADLPRQIERASMLVDLLRGPSLRARSDGPTDRLPEPAVHAIAAA